MLSTSEARQIQNELRRKVVTTDDFGPVKTVAGVDLSHKDGRSRCAIVVLSADGLTEIETVTHEGPLTFPYIPGLLSFREIPVILETIALLKTKPDLLMMDGQGMAHPRRLGVASHLGVLTGIPSIGVAKSRLCGHHREPGPDKGLFVPLLDGGEQIGAVVRTKLKCKPLYISPGHRISLESSVEWVLRMLGKYRLPEPTRRADKLSKL